MSRKKKVITYGRKFRTKSGQTARYVYKHRKKIGLVLILAADAVLPDSEAELNRKRASKPGIAKRFREEIDTLRGIYHMVPLMVIAGKSIDDRR